MRTRAAIAKRRAHFLAAARTRRPRPARTGDGWVACAVTATAEGAVGGEPATRAWFWGCWGFSGGKGCCASNKWVSASSSFAFQDPSEFLLTRTFLGTLGGPE